MATERAAPAARAPLPPPAAGDEQWATTFGAVDVAAGPAAIAVRGDEVFLGGDFTTEMAGMLQDMYVRVAHRDGSGWRRMGDGVDATVYATPAGARTSTSAGSSPSPAAPSRRTAWRGGTAAAGRRWRAASAPAAPGSRPTRALASDGAKLYVAGVFDTVERAPWPRRASRCSTRHRHLGGRAGRGCGGPGSPVRAAAALAGDRLYVGGSFSRAGAVESASIAALDLATGDWVGFGAGMRSEDFVGTVDSLAADPATGTVYRRPVPERGDRTDVGGGDPPRRAVRHARRACTTTSRTR